MTKLQKQLEALKEMNSLESKTLDCYSTRVVVPKLLVAIEELRDQRDSLLTPAGLLHHRETMDADILKLLSEIIVNQ